MTNMLKLGGEENLFRTRLERTSRARWNAFRIIPARNGRDNEDGYGLLRNPESAKLRDPQAKLPRLARGRAGTSRCAKNQTDLFWYGVRLSDARQEKPSRRPARCSHNLQDCGGPQREIPSRAGGAAACGQPPPPGPPRPHLQCLAKSAALLGRNSCRPAQVTSQLGVLGVLKVGTYQVSISASTCLDLPRTSLPRQVGDFHSTNPLSSGLPLIARHAFSPTCACPGWPPFVIHVLAGASAAQASTLLPALRRLYSRPMRRASNGWNKDACAARSLCGLLKKSVWAERRAGADGLPILTWDYLMGTQP